MFLLKQRRGCNPSGSWFTATVLKTCFRVQASLNSNDTDRGQICMLLIRSRVYPMRHGEINLSERVCKLERDTAPWSRGASMLLARHHGANTAVQTGGNSQETAQRLFAPRQRQWRNSPVRTVSAAQVLESELETRIQSNNSATTQTPVRQGLCSPRHGLWNTCTPASSADHQHDCPSYQQSH